jgi:hypothetical protein
MNLQIKEFFSRFEIANNSSNFSAFNELYAERFMFGDPNGVHVVERECFLTVLPTMKAHFSSIGLFDSKVQTLEAHPLNSKYLLAKVGWRMEIRRSSVSTHVDAFATFVLVRGPADGLSIVFQIDHQDLATVIKNQQEAE